MDGRRRIQGAMRALPLLTAALALAGGAFAQGFTSDFGSTPGYDHPLPPPPGVCNNFYCNPADGQCWGPALTHCVIHTVWSVHPRGPWTSQEHCCTLPCAP